MNSHKTALRVLIVAQVFTLFALILMPVLVKLLSDTWGRVIYTLLSLAGIALALALRYALNALE